MMMMIHTNFPDLWNLNFKVIFFFFFLFRTSNESSNGIAPKPNQTSKIDMNRIEIYVEKR